MRGFIFLLIIFACIFSSYSMEFSMSNKIAYLQRQTRSSACTEAAYKACKAASMFCRIKKNYFFVFLKINFRLWVCK